MFSAYLHQQLISYCHFRMIPFLCIERFFVVRKGIITLDSVFNFHKRRLDVGDNVPDLSHINISKKGISFFFITVKLADFSIFQKRCQDFSVKTDQNQLSIQSPHLDFPEIQNNFPPENVHILLSDGSEGRIPEFQNRRKQQKPPEPAPV